MPRANRIHILTISGILIVVATVFFILRKPESENELSVQALASAPVLTVTTTRPQSISLPQKITANGDIQAWQEAVIGAEANGLRLLRMNVNLGDWVEAGQTLAAFATETLEADLDLAKATVAENRASLEEATANADRARKLQASGSLPAQQIQALISAETVAKARLQAAIAEENVQKLRFVQARVVAPESGIISGRVATIGSVIPTGEEMFRLILGGRLEWQAEVAAVDLAKIEPGQQANIIPTAGEPVKGLVRMLAPTINTLTRNGLVYVDLPAGSGVLPGMFARGEIEVGNQKSLTIPLRSLLLRDGFSYVFRMGKNNEVIQTKVKTGQRHSDQVEIIEGLRFGDTVVASGVGFLSDGDRVNVVNESIRVVEETSHPASEASGNGEPKQ